MATPISANRQRRVWTKRAEGWDHGSVTGLEVVIDTVLDRAQPQPGEFAVDLGCGTGALTIPLARRCGQVLAVDVSDAMIDRLRARLSDAGLGNVETRTVPIEQLELPPASVDLVVSNYALHHLRDRDKQVVVERAAIWLRPGGRLAVGDMMFGRGGEARDWAIAAGKMRALGRRGPGGWWRIAKNLWRYLWRVQERPVSLSAWTAMFERAGFEDLSNVSVHAEAGVVAGRRKA